MAVNTLDDSNSIPPVSPPPAPFGSRQTTSHRISRGQARQVARRADDGRESSPNFDRGAAIKMTSKEFYLIYKGRMYKGTNVPHAEVDFTV